MSPLSIRLALAGLACYASCAVGLSVTPGSQCEAACAARDGADEGSLEATVDMDIVCEDNQYSTTEAGRRFKACTDCLKNSKHTNGSESDLSALLFNFRLGVETCLFNDDRKASEITGCLSNDACLPLADAIAFDDLEPDPEDMYGYCTANDKSFLGRHTQSCLTCLHSSDKHVFVANFMTVLTGGCAYMPDAGETLHFTGDVFSHDEIFVKAPGEQDGDTLSPAPKDDSSPTLSREFTIGIVVGISLLFAIAIILFFIYYLRFRKRDIPPDPHPRRSLRHEPSIDPDPVLFSGAWRHPWASDSDGESVGYEGSSVEGFDYVHAAVMAQKPEAKGMGMPAHAAYKPSLKSRNSSLAMDVERGPMRTGSASESSRAPSPPGQV